MPNEPSNAEIKALLESHIARSERTDVQRIEWQTRTGDAIRHMSEGLANIVTRVEHLEKNAKSDRSLAEEAYTSAQKAMVSVTNLEEHIRTAATEQGAVVVAMLHEQNENSARVERERVANAKRESDAREALESSRSHKARMATILVPAAVAVLVAVLGVVGNYLTTRALHADNAAKVDALRRDVESRPTPYYPSTVTPSYVTQPASAPAAAPPPRP